MESKEMKLYVGGIPNVTSVEDLKDYFKQFAEVTDVYIPQLVKGFGYVTLKFASHHDCHSMLKRPHNMTLRKSHKILYVKLDVKKADSMPQMNPRQRNKDARKGEFVKVKVENESCEIIELQDRTPPSTCTNNTVTPQFQTQCKYFRIGQCKLGSTCRFIHSGIEDNDIKRKMGVSPKEKEEIPPKIMRHANESKNLTHDLDVFNLPWDCTGTDLNEYFGAVCGELVYFRAKCPHTSNKGFGFIKFKTVEGEKAALNRQHWIKGCTLTVKAKESSEFEMKLYVGGIPKLTSVEDLKDYFKQFGKITDAYIPQPLDGFGYVTLKFPSLYACRSMLRRPHNMTLRKSNIKIWDVKLDVKAADSMPQWKPRKRKKKVRKTDSIPQMEPLQRKDARKTDSIPQMEPLQRNQNEQKNIKVERFNKPADYDNNRNKMDSRNRDGKDDSRDVENMRDIQGDLRDIGDYNDSRKRSDFYATCGKFGNDSPHGTASQSIRDTRDYTNNRQYRDYNTPCSNYKNDTAFGNVSQLKNMQGDMSDMRDYTDNRKYSTYNYTDVYHENDTTRDTANDTTQDTANDTAQDTTSQLKNVIYSMLGLH